MAVPQRDPNDDGLEPEFKVAEARTKDVGRGIAQLDPADMERYGLETGNILRIRGKDDTVAKAMPAFPEDRGKRVVQIDGLIRGNAGVGLDGKVSLEKIDFKPAKKVQLAPVTALRAGHRRQEGRFVGRVLEGLVLTRGDRIRATMFSNRGHDFTVVGCAPAGAVMIHPLTAIEIVEEGGGGARRERITYEDIGGLHRETQKIREMIELPLKYPEVFEQLGIDAPKGVFLHGPPGCGKTLIARAVANETDAQFFTLSGPEIMHKFYGESEAHLRGIFEAASPGPSIIFLDEIDAIAPKRAELGGEKQVERRVVSQLLTLMDGLESRGQVIVIAATNLPNSVDSALRRPGRFDREISIGVPDKIGREEILEIYTRGMPLADDVDLEKLAQITHGFVGADLEALCREAAMATLRKIFPDIDFDLEQIPYETLETLSVGMDDFFNGLAVVDPSAIREVFTEVPDVKWDDVGGLDEAKRVLRESVEWPINHAGLYDKAGIVPPKGILLHGAPGLGKTLLAKAVATESGVNFISVKGPALLSKWVGESERAVREVFHKAKQASPCIVFLDEVDSLAPRRGGSEASAVTDRIIAQLLTEMDGVEELKGVTVLAATNRKDLVDPALLRSGRFDFLIELPMPDARTRRAIFEIHCRDMPLSADVDLERLGGKPSQGLTGADIEAACKKAATAAMREYIAGKRRAAGNDDDFEIASEHFDIAFGETREAE